MRSAMNECTMSPLRNLLLATPLPLVLACGLQTCPEVETTSDTSSGSYTYTTAKGSGVAPTSTSGSIPVSGGVSVAAESSSSIAVQGNFYDDANQPHAFTLTVTGGAANSLTQIGSDSQACMDDDVCAPIAGTLGVATYSLSCEGSSGCALNIVGELKAITTWNGATFTVDLELNHSDTVAAVACGNDSTEGS